MRHFAEGLAIKLEPPITFGHGRNCGDDHVPFIQNGLLTLSYSSLLVGKGEEIGSGVVIGARITLDDYRSGGSRLLHCSNKQLYKSGILALSLESIIVHEIGRFGVIELKGPIGPISKSKRNASAKMA